MNINIPFLRDLKKYPTSMLPRVAWEYGHTFVPVFRLSPTSEVI
jgi:hypothetical protein